MLSARMMASQRRCFSSSVASRSILDYFKFYKKKSDEPKIKSTEQVIKEVEEGGSKVGAPDKVRILGRRHPAAEDKQVLLKNLNGFQISSWIPKNSVYSKKIADGKVYTEVVDEMLNYIKEKNAELDLANIADRFQVLKVVQQKFGLEIPDRDLSKLSDYETVQKYLVDRLDPARTPVDELLPDKVELETLEASNVSTGRFVFEKDKTKELKKMMRNANRLEKKSLQEAETE